MTHKPLTVALVSHAPYMTGAERMLFNLAQLLKNTEGIEPFLIIPREGPLSLAAAQKGIRYRLIPSLPWYLFHVQNYQEKLQDAVATIRSTLIEMESDIVVVNTLTNVASMIAAVQINLPTLLWVHGIIDSVGIPEKRVSATVHDELLMRCASTVVANSLWTGSFYERMMSPGQLQVIHNWTDVGADFAAPEEKYASKRFSCLNTFDLNKGHQVLLNAAASVREQGYNFRLDLYGEGPTFTDSKKLAEKLKIADIVNFSPPTKTVSMVYDRSVCLINPSYVESFGMTLVEAMARKTPVISSASGGPGEIISDGVDGFLVPSGDVKALADRMARILSASSADLQKMGEMGFQKVHERFSEACAQGKFVRLLKDTATHFHGYPGEIRLLVDTYLSNLNEFKTAEGDKKVSKVEAADRAAMSSAYGIKARSLAAQLDDKRERKFIKLYQRFLDRSDLSGLVGGSFASFLENGDGALRRKGYRLLPSINLQRVPFIAYPLEIGRPNLLGIRLALALDLPVLKGRMGIELVSPDGKIVARADIPAVELDEAKPAQFSFTPVEKSARPGHWLRIYVREVDVPVRIFEWQKYPWFGLKNQTCRPFCDFAFLSE